MKQTHFAPGGHAKRPTLGSMQKLFETPNVSDVTLIVFNEKQKCYLET